MMLLFRAILLLSFLLPVILCAEPKLEQFFAQNCIKCHGPEKQKGKVRLDKPVGALFADEELLEIIAAVLEAGEMPPESAPQPTATARAEALQIVQEQILTQRPANPLKRLTRAEYTNTMHDLFGVDFDLTGLLPPDHVEHGFDKFGEAHLMSPHQVMAYLKTARFIAERVLPDAKPEAEFLLALPTIRANFIPTLPITRPVSLDILGQSVQRKVRRGEGKEMKERFAGMLLLMLLQHRDRVIGNRVGCIKVRANRRSRLTLVIKEMKFQPKETMVIDVVRTVESIGHRHAVDVPFTGVVRAIAGWLQHHRQQPRPFRPVAPPHGARAIAPHLLRVITGQHRCPRRPASCCVVKLRKAQAVPSQTVKMRRGNLASVTAEIRIAHVISHDHQNIRRLGVSPVQVQQQYCKQTHEQIQTAFCGRSNLLHPTLAHAP